MSVSPGLYQSSIASHANMGTRICTLTLCPHDHQFVKRDALLEIEGEVQLKWERDHVFEVDAPQVH